MSNVSCDTPIVRSTNVPAISPLPFLRSRRRCVDDMCSRITSYVPEIAETFTRDMKCANIGHIPSGSNRMQFVGRNTSRNIIGEFRGLDRKEVELSLYCCYASRFSSEVSS